MNRRTKNSGTDKRLLADEAFRYIGARILDGALPAGQRIRDLDVAEHLGLSRTPVREALQRLERLGMVSMYPSRYTEVTAVTEDVTAQALAFAGYQAGIAARTAVPRLTAPQREYLAALVQPMCSALDGSEPAVDARWSVFSYLGEHCGNVPHRALMAESALAIRRNLREWSVPPEDERRMREIYADFRDAVLVGDGVEAERLAREMHYL
ncbi:MULTISPECIES: GntR family transcriptional regulator [unclassified Microbacterium]|uniref:GntR family transcriptional regulator n=1 Tax=unclassified Microbacterium TaxID=2609290 RepID=UPI000EA8C7C0|nr:MULTISPECIES: GntR family transcriptional regulator [unclassified Microbacterium]MBT2483375.1 GntR family transcriptional regulator [Microbacterium sp. ISL-108]RKN66407.1 GntR family transcriptional regulator [Microbacterium sp. CGR2]